MIELPTRIAEHIDQFTGRAWLLPKILDWWKDPKNERLFLLTGGPGTGKSMILAWLAGHGPIPVNAEAQQQLAELRAGFKAAHFCIADSGNTDPKEVARQIADQLTRRVPGFGKALAATLGDQVHINSVLKDVTVQQGGSATGVYIGYLNLQGLSEELSYNRVLRAPLQQLYSDGYDQPMLLLFDALDEALTYSGQTHVVKMLAKFKDLPPQVRILATTRAEPRVLIFFDIKPLDLIKDADPHTDDVLAYAQGRLQKLDTIGKSKSESFAERLSTQSKGIFLYAALVLDELLTGHPSQLPNLDTYSLPNGLSGLYRSFLTRELGTEDKGRRWHRVYKPLLGLIAVAQGDGLTAEQLTTLTGEEVAEPLDACKQYLSGDLPDGPFKPFHKSFTDFLIEDKKKAHYYIDAQAMHARIAEYYWSKHHRDWSQCESYGLDHLAIHLFKASQFERLDELISPGWMQARVKGSGYRYAGFVADLMLAWQTAQEKANRQIEANDEAFTAFATCFRYALIRTSINSLSTNYPSEVVARALETQVWSVERALDVCMLTRDPRQRAHLYTAVLTAGKTTLSNARWDKLELDVCTAAEAITDQWDRSQALATLAPHLNTARVEEVFRAARAIGEHRAQSRVLAALAPRLSTPQVEEALAAVLAMMAHGGRARALAALAPQLSTAQVEKALKAALAITNQWERAQVLAALAPRLSTTQVEEALTAAQTITMDLWRVEALAALAPRLSTAQQTNVLEEALAAAFTIADSKSRARALAALSSRLSTAQVGETLRAARAIADGESRAKALAALSPRLSTTQQIIVLEEALTVARVITHDKGRAKALAALSPHLSTAQVEEALTAARAITMDLWRTEALAALAPRLSTAQVEKALTLALTIADGEGRAKALLVLAPRLSTIQQTNVLEEALTAALTIADNRSRAGALVTLVSRLRAAQIKEVLTAARAIADSKSRAEALVALAPRLSKIQQTKVLEEALRATGTITHSKSRAEVLAALVPRLSKKRQANVLEEALTAVLTMEVGWERDQALAALIPHLSPAQVEETLRAAQAITDSKKRAEALTALAPQLSKMQQSKVLEEALRAARAITDYGDRDNALAALIPHLSTVQVEEALRAALTIADSKSRAEVLAALAPRLSKKRQANVLEEALRAVLTMEVGWERDQALAALIPQLGAAQVEEALTAARAITANRERDDALAALIPHLSPAQVEETLRAAQAITDSKKRAEALTALAPQLSKMQQSKVLEEALRAARAITDYGDRDNALAALIPHLSTVQVKEALGAAQAITDTTNRLTTLLALPALHQNSEFLQEMRRCLENRVEREAEDTTRAGLLDSILTEIIVRSPIIGTETISMIVQHIVEIDKQWHWV